LIPLMTAVAVADAIGDVCRVEVGLKWPNDILIGSHKAGGILVETSDDRVTVGCGLNLWWPDAIEGAVALFDADPGPGVALDVAKAWANGLMDALAGHPDVWDLSRYVGLSATVGRHVAWAGGEGEAVGIGADGSLIVDTPGGRTFVNAGEVHLHGHR
jgi:BirA family biotin operon repressor/biotin-[acetyl-CoA-carboxylase] ligase